MRPAPTPRPSPPRSRPGAQVARLLAQPDSAGPRYGVRRYSPLAHAFNLFSYGVVQSPSGNAVSVGLRSQDLLNTTQVFAGVGYDQTERTFSATGAAELPGPLPGAGCRRDLRRARCGHHLPGPAAYRDQWQYARLTAGLRLPLNLTHSKYLQALTLGTYFLHEQVYGYDLPARRLTETGPNTPAQRRANHPELRHAAQAQCPRAWPRGGAAPSWAPGAPRPSAPGWRPGSGRRRAACFCRAWRRNHAIRLRAGYQWQDQLQYQFAPAVSIPRGEGYTSFDRLAVASFDYNLPLAFTHWELGRLLYVQRLRATVFGDVAQGNDYRGTAAQLTYRNAGADVLVLFNVLRLRTPLEAGVRVVYRGAVGPGWSSRWRSACGCSIGNGLLRWLAGEIRKHKRLSWAITFAGWGR